MLKFLQNVYSVMREVRSQRLETLLVKTDSVSGRLQLAGFDRPAENLIWIYLGLKSRSEKISQVPLRISDGDDNIVTSGNLFDLLKRPNLFMDCVQYLALIEKYLALYDECFVAKISEGKGSTPDSLYPLSPQGMEPILATHQPTGLRVAAGWIYRDPQTGQGATFMWEDLIPILSHNPHEPIRALWPTKPGMRTMKADMASREQNLAIFLNGGMPDVVFETEQPWKKEQADEFLERWQDRYGGYGKRHKPGLLYGGLKAKGIGLSPTELQFLEGLRMSREEQIALMRVKPAMVGLMTGENGLSQGTSTPEQVAAWWGETGLYELERIAAAHNEFLVKPYSWNASVTREATRMERDVLSRRQKKNTTLEVWFDENKIKELVEHRLAKIATAKNLREMGYKPDDVNEYLDLRLPPHPTNEATLPMGLQSVNDIDSAEIRKPAEPAREHTSEAVRSVDRIEQLIRESDQGGTPKKYKAIRENLDKMIGGHEKQYAKKMSRYFVEQRGRMLERLIGEAVRADERKAADIDVAALMQKQIENDFLTKRITPVMYEILKSGWENLNREVGANQNHFEVQDPRITAALDARKIQATKVNDTTEDDIRDILKTSVEAGETVTQLGDRIAEYYNQNAAGETAARPMTAARTQVAGLVNDGRMASANKVKGLKKAWLHGGSADPRPAHLEAQSKYLNSPIPLDEKFEVNGVEMDAPGDANAPIEEVANCTCMVVFSPENS